MCVVLGGMILRLRRDSLDVLDKAFNVFVLSKKFDVLPYDARALSSYPV